MSDQEGKILVLCVDRDNDVGQLLKVKTPIIGEKNVLDVALKYILLRPDDSDSNAMFAAIQTLREMRELKGENNVEVAVIAGLEEEGVKADMKILRELDEILSKMKVSGVILVSDGPTDEAVAPLIQSRVPIISIRRVIVQQSRGVEETFVLLIRYMKKLVEEEKYRKYTLGVPGVFFMFYILLSYLIPNFVWPLLIFFFGLLLFIKGYKIDEKFRTIYKTSPVTFASLILSGIVFTIALLQGITSVLTMRITSITEMLGYLLLAPVGGQFIVADLFTLGAVFPVLGKIFDNIIAGKEVKIIDTATIGVILISRQVAVEIGKFLTGYGDIRSILTWLFITLGAVVVAVLTVSLTGKKEDEKRK
ncbi:MAG: hypothetical protein DRJ35_00195 [Thermoprotei archaeon]|nr:MAG: hypothetical protein DRJ35_00195 [Thermoprotei archaeon]